MQNKNGRILKIKIIGVNNYAMMLNSFKEFVVMDYKTKDFNYSSNTILQNLINKYFLLMESLIPIQNLKSLSNKFHVNKINKF